MADEGTRRPPIHHPTWTDVQSGATLRAMWSVATNDGKADLTAGQEEMLHGTRSHILGHGDEVPIPAEGIEPDDLVRVMEDPDHRVRAAQLIAVVPFVDPMLDDRKPPHARDYAGALGIDLDGVAEWHDAHESAQAHFDRHHLVQEFCALRKLEPEALPDDDEASDKQKLLRKMMREAEGDPAEVARYQALGELAPGTLGRAFYDFYEVPPQGEIGPDGKSAYGRPWPFPGSVAWVPEELTVYHDLIHVLNGYYIDVPGEFEVAGFTAGNNEHFSWMVAMLGFMPPYRRGNTAFDVDRFLDAFDRGKNATTSLSYGWNWWADAARPIDDLRREFGIVIG